MTNRTIYNNTTAGLRDLAEFMLSPERAEPRGYQSRLDVLAEIRAALEYEIVAEVRLQRRARVSWASIGLALGVTASGAQQRFASKVPAERHRSKLVHS